MRLHNRALVAVILSLAGFYSCSRQATIPTQLTYTPVPVFTIPDSLLATSPIEYAFYKAEPVEFFEPKPEVRDSFNLKINRRDTVLSAFDGIVRMTGWSRGYGNVVVVRHYNGLETVYAHNSKHLVRSGDHVKAGTPVSITGETGRATTDHVHFEIRVNGKTIDPALVINLNTQTLLHKRLVFTPTPKGKIQVEAV